MNTNSPFEPVDFPILFVIGAARSGTTLLGEKLIANHPDVVYWSEPNHVWRTGNTFGDSERRTHEDAVGEVVEKIRLEFRQYFAEHSGRILVDKTPSNCLRLPFIRCVFPGAKFVHLVRDGRDVALSARKQWEGGRTNADQDKGGLVEGVAEWLDIMISEVRGRDMLQTIEPHQLPYYVMRATKLLWSRLTGRSTLWGPKVPGLKEISEQHSVLETCAWQWKGCLKQVEEDWEAIPRDQRMEIRYESLLRAPREGMARILRFADLDLVEQVERELEEIRPDNTGKWRDRLNRQELHQLQQLIGETLQRHGYDVIEN